MITQTLSKSIDFLLENAGPVIQYRLRKEIFHCLLADKEETINQRNTSETNSNAPCGKA